MKQEIDIAPAIKKLEITSKNIVTSMLIGNYKSVFKGKGLEFESYRNYTPGDDASLIDWKASARTNEILVKEYVEERNVNIFFLIDASNSMISGTAKLLKNEYVAQIVASLSYAALNAGDSIGMGLFSDELKHYLHPERGKKQFYIITKNLVKTDHYGGGCNIEIALKKSLNILPDNTILIIISDFIGLQKDWSESLKIASKKFDIIGVMVKDNIDENLPDNNNLVLLEDVYTQKQILINPQKASAAYQQESKKHTLEIKNIFHKYNSGFINLNSSQDFLLPIINFFNMRRKLYK